MKTTLSRLFTDHGGKILLIIGVIAYVMISGMFGACPTCRIITKSVGLPQLGK